MVNADKLKAIMKECRVTLEQLAQKLGITEVMLNAKMNGKMDFYLEEVLSLILFLRIERPGDIFFNS